MEERITPSAFFMIEELKRSNGNLAIHPKDMKGGGNDWKESTMRKNMCVINKIFGKIIDFNTNGEYYWCG